jgi:hypothetical protein
MPHVICDTETKTENGSRKKQKKCGNDVRVVGRRCLNYPTAGADSAKSGKEPVIPVFRRFSMEAVTLQDHDVCPV